MSSSIAPLHQGPEDERPRAEINMSQIRVGGGIPGFIFAAGTVYIFFAGIPEVRWFLAGAIAVGAVISIALRLFHRCKPAQPTATIASWIERFALTGEGAGGGEIVARYSPDTTDSWTGVDKNGRRRQANEAHQKSVFNQVLALFVLQEAAQGIHDSIFAEGTIEPQDDI
jgi:hypothetical protein